MRKDNPIMLCYSCAEEGIDRPAVALCRSCNAGLCVEHLHATASRFASSHMLDACHHDTWTAVEPPARTAEPVSAERAPSPLGLFLGTFDRLDADACALQFADDGRLRYSDGHCEQGRTAVRERLRDYFADLRSTEHIVREHWHCHDVWIGEVEATYVLVDHSILGPLSMVFIMRMAGAAIQDLRVYAAGEPSFHEAAIRHDSELDRGFLVGGRWTPPL